MTPDLGGEVVRCSRLLRIYLSAQGETHALRGVDAVFRSGTVTAVTGPSGSGKTSLLSVVGLQERQDGGELSVLGHDVSALSGRALRELRRRHVAWVSQRPTQCLFPHLTAREHVRQVALVRGAGGVSADEPLERVALGARARAFPRLLSGGEQQRLAVALAAVGAPALVVADEPTAELDDATSALVLAELRGCAQEGAAVVVATHDARVVAAADRVLALRHGVLSSERERDGVTTAAIDSTGRLQLPPEALDLFPGGRAVVTLEDGGVRLRPLPEPGEAR